MTANQLEEMYENVWCPKCMMQATANCEDLRKSDRGGGEHCKPHRERIAAYRRWKIKGSQ